jgi:sulfur carrier protein ThiS adenylyltransferase
MILSISSVLLAVVNKLVFYMKINRKYTKKEIENLIFARHTPGVYKKMKEPTIGIAGAGGLGSNIAISLARTGIGRIIIADFDIIEPSNLNRQAFYLDQVGKVKVLALKENIKRINPYIKVVTHHKRVNAKNVISIFKEVDILIEAFDNPIEKTKLINAFSKKFPCKNIIMASGLAGYEPSNWIKTRKIGDYLYIVGDMKTEADIKKGTMSPRVGIAAHHQANLAVRLIMAKI